MNLKVFENKHFFISKLLHTKHKVYMPWSSNIINVVGNQRHGRLCFWVTILLAAYPATKVCTCQCPLQLVEIRWLLSYYDTALQLNISYLLTWYSVHSRYTFMACVLNFAALFISNSSLIRRCKTKSMFYYTSYPICIQHGDERKKWVIKKQWKTLFYMLFFILHIIS